MPAPVIGLFLKGLTKGLAKGVSTTAKNTKKIGKNTKISFRKLKRQKLRTNKFLQLDKQYENRKRKKAKLSSTKNLFSTILTNPLNIVDTTKSVLTLIFFGTLFNSLPFILKTINRIIEQTKKAFENLKAIIISVKDSAESFIKVITDNKYYKKLEEFFKNDKSQKNIQNLEKNANELENETKKLTGDLNAIEKQVLMATKGVDPKTGLFIYSLPDDPILKEGFQDDLYERRTSFSNFIKDFNDEAVDSIVAVLGLTGAVAELKDELNSRFASKKQKKQIKKQLERIQSSSYEVPATLNTFNNEDKNNKLTSNNFLLNNESNSTFNDNSLEIVFVNKTKILTS